MIYRSYAVVVRQSFIALDQYDTMRNDATRDYAFVSTRSMLIALAGSVSLLLLTRSYIHTGTAPQGEPCLLTV